MIRTIQVVFDGPSSHEMPRFVDVEDAQGRSISVGEWKERADGKWAGASGEARSSWAC
jgi:hypothetical protein